MLRGHSKWFYCVHQSDCSSGSGGGVRSIQSSVKDLRPDKCASLELIEG